MMIALRKADLVVSVGAELEQGWLPSALQGASNPKVLVGQLGYFAGVRAGLAHRQGAGRRPLARRRPPDGEPARLPRPRADGRHRPRPRRAARAPRPRPRGPLPPNAEAFAREADARVAAWKKSAAGVSGVVLYHKDANYLMALLGVPVLGYVEPLPGFPPRRSTSRTSSHG